MTVETFQLNLDDGGYQQNIHAANASTQMLAESMGHLSLNAQLAAKALAVAAPAGAILGMNRFTREASAAQVQLKQIQATAQVTGTNFGALQRQADSLTRSFGIGARGGRDMIQTLQGLGVTANRNARNYRELATSFIELGHATGENSRLIGSQLANLERSFGNVNLNDKQFRAASDSLVALQAKVGGSASSIVSFSQAIAPFSRDLGLSEKATMGVAASFTKLGDESNSAMTAVSKMFADISHAVRDGGMELQKYADLVGMTAGQFRDMAKTNPAQAVQSVVSSFASTGVQGQYALEGMGYGSGIRTQRALQSLIQAGDLPGTLQTAIGAAPGTAASAGHTAADTLNESLTKLSGTSTQLAEKMGQPLLGPLADFASGLNTVTGALAKGVGSGPVQSVLNVGAFPLMAGAGLLLKGAIARRASQSGTADFARFGAYGAARGMPDLLEDPEGYREALFNQSGFRASRMQRRFARQEERGFFNPQLDAEGNRTGMDAVRAGAYGFGAGARTGRLPGQEPGDPGMGVRQRFRLGMQYGNVVTADSMDFMTGLATGKNRTAPELSQLGRGLLGGMKTAMGRGGDDDEVKGREAVTKGWKEMTAAGKEFHGTLREASRESAGFSRSLGAGRRRLGALAGGAAGILGDVTGMAVSGLTTPVGAATAAAAGGLYLYEQHRQEQERLRQAREDFRESSVTQSYDVLNAGLGRGARGTTTVAQLRPGEQQAAQMPKQPDYASVFGTSFHRDLVQRGVAGGSAYNKDDKEGTLALLKSQFAGGLDPEEFGQLKLQLRHRGFSDEEANDLLKQAQPSITQPQARLDPKALGQAAGGLQRYAQKHEGTYSFHDSRKLGKGTERNVEALLASIDEQYQRDTEATGDTEYAETNRRAAIGALYSGAGRRVVGQGKDEEGAVQKYIRNQLKGDYDPRKLVNQGFQNAPPTRPGGMYDQLSTSMGGGNERFLGLFDRRTSGGKTLTEQIFGISPSDAKGQGEVVLSMTKGAGAAGMSLQNLALVAGRAAANATGVQQQTALRQTAQAALTRSMGAAGSAGAASAMQFGSTLNTAIGGTAIPEEERVAAAQSLAEQMNAEKEVYRQRIAAQINFQTQSGRAWTDYYTQRGRAEDDFARNRSRAIRDFNRSMQRQAEDGARTMFDPYRRMQVEPLWDARALRTNMGEQIQAMRNQVRNLKKARQLGLSNATIQMLDLANPAHAQQLQELISTMSTGDARAFNAQTQQRTALAGQLNTDPGNVNFVRARQDFQQSMKDQNQDFAISNARMASDFRRNMGRMKEDLHNSFLTITTDWNKLQGNLDTTMNSKSAKARGVMVDDMHEFNSLLQSQFGTTAIDMAALWDQVAMLMNPGGVGATIQIRMDKNGLPIITINGKKANASSEPTTYEPWREDRPAPTGSTQTASPSHGAAGRLITSNTYLNAGEAGAEALIPLNAGGLHIIRAIERYLGEEFGGKRAQESRMHVVVNAGSYVYDHSVTVEKVESHADSVAFIAEMREMQRRKNLTASSTRKTS